MFEDNRATDLIRSNKVDIRTFLREQKKSVLYLLVSLLILILVSNFKQLMELFYPRLRFTAVVVFTIHSILLSIWWASIRHRITILHIKWCLVTECFIMQFWVFVKFLQDFVLFEDTAALRFSGYFIAFPMLVVPLMGFYAALGLGQSQSFRLGHKHHMIGVPAGILIVLMLTSDWHQLVFTIDPADPQPNVIFHPGPFLYVTIAYAILMSILQIVLVFRRSKTARYGWVVRAVPIFCIILLLVLNIPYFLQSFVVSWEFIEYGPLMFFIDIFLWESCITGGLVSVNSRYGEIFNRSTVAMQILDDSGHLLRSPKVPKGVTDEEFFRRLLKYGPITEGDWEYHIAKLREGYVVWKSDISELRNAVQQLTKVKKELRSDAELLRNELAVRSREESIRARNEIYNQISDEVHTEMVKGGEILQKLKQISEEKEDKTLITEPERVLFSRLCVLGTYIKRRSNLRLMQLSGDTITAGDLTLGYRDLMAALRKIGIDAEDPTETLDGQIDPEQAIRQYDHFFRQYEEEVVSL